MKVMYLKDIVLRVGFGFGSDKAAFDRRCIWISDALTAYLSQNLNLTANYPRIVVSFNSPQALETPQVVFFAGSRRLNLPRYAELRLVASHDMFLGSAVELRNTVRMLLQDNLGLLFSEFECDEAALRQLIGNVLTRDEFFEASIEPLTLVHTQVNLDVQIFLRTTDRDSKIYAVVEYAGSPVKIEVPILAFERPTSLLGFRNINLSIRNGKLILKSHNKKQTLAEVALPPP